MAKSKNSVLWKLNHQDTHYQSYLLGTMHVQDQKAFGHFTTAQALIETCQLVACEYDLTEANSSAHALAVLIPEGGTISSLLGPKKYAKIESILKKSLGISLSHYDRMLPMVLMGLISAAILRKDNQQSLDQSIWDCGLKTGKKMTGVESYSSQLTLLKKIDLKYQTKALVDATKNIAKYRSNILTLTQQYQDEKIHLLYKNTKRSLGKYKHQMLFNRNKLMTDRIDKLSRENHCFFAIGAAHLSGKQGLIHLLKKKAWQLKPM